MRASNISARAQTKILRQFGLDQSEILCELEDNERELAAPSEQQCDADRLSPTKPEGECTQAKDEAELSSGGTRAPAL